jgi:hypothetical protein
MIDVEKKDPSLHHESPPKRRSAVAACNSFLDVKEKKNDVRWSVGTEKVDSFLDQNREEKRCRVFHGH